MRAAGRPPRKGAVQKTQWLSQAPAMSAGPKARAGLMHMLLTDPSSHISSGTMSPTESGPSRPQPLCNRRCDVRRSCGNEQLLRHAQTSSCNTQGAARNVQLRAPRTNAPFSQGVN